MLCIIKLVIVLNMILRTVSQERDRIEYMLDRYQRTLAQLPKGSISEKAVSGKTYYYLKYRDGKKVISRYLRSMEVDTVREQLARRKHVEAMIKSLQEEKVIADKVLEGIE